MFVNQKNYFFCINFNRLILFFYFICFGFYGALVPSSVIYENNKLYHFIFEILIIFIPVIFILLIKNKNIYTFQIKFHKEYLIYFFLFIFIFILNLFPLDYELFSDEQSYVLIGHIHSIEATKKLVNFLPYFFNFKINDVVRIFSLFSVFFIVINYYIFQNLNSKLFLIYFLLSLIIFRIFVFNLGGFMSPHPIISHLPLLFAGVFFGFSPIVFKTSIMILYFLFAVVLCSKAFKEKYEKFIFILILLTLPNIEYLKHTVEPSIWTFIIFSVIGSIFIIKKKIEDFSFLIILAVIFCFFRQPSFLILTLIFLFNIFDHLKFNSSIKFSSLFQSYLPFILFLPYLINSIFLGTGSNSSLLKNSPYKQFDNNLVSLKEIYENTFLIIPEIYLIIFILFFILIITRNIKHFIFYLLFFVILITVYFSINSHQFNIAKYKIEYFSPFIVYFCVLIGKYKSLIKYSSLIFILILNIYYYFNPLWKKDNKLITQSKPINFAGVHYNVRPIIKLIIKEKALNKIYFEGISYHGYEFFSQNITIKEYLNILKKKFGKTNFYDVIKKNKLNNEFEYVILAATPNQTEKSNFLINHGWQKVKVEFNKRDNTQVLLFQKKTNN